MNDLLKRVERLEKKQCSLPMAIVTLSTGEQKRLDITQIAQRFLYEPDDIRSVEWVDGDCAGTICQLLATDDYWEELRRIKHDQN